MNPNWLWWSAGPGTVPIAWFLVWRRTDTAKYALFASCYLILYGALALMPFSLVLAGSGRFIASGILGPVWFLLFVGLWFGGFWHVRCSREEIRLRLKFAAAARTHRKEVAFDLEDRIRLEYGFDPRKPVSSKSPHAPPKREEDQLDRDIAAILQEHRRNRQQADAIGRQILARQQESIRHPTGYRVEERRSFPPSPRFPPLQTDESNANLDVNRASRETLADIPGIGTTLALEIVEERDRSGPFRSTDDFFQRCRIKPHVRIRLEKRVVIDSTGGDDRGRPDSMRHTGKTKRSETKPRRID